MRLFGGKILRVYCWEKNQPANFNKTDYQTLSITYISFYLVILFHGHAKRLCPDRIVVLVHVPNFKGVSGLEDRGGGDNSIQFINIGRVGDKSFKE